MNIDFDDDSDLSPMPTVESASNSRRCCRRSRIAPKLSRSRSTTSPAKDPRRAGRLLAGKEAKLLIDSDTRDDLRAAIAEGYLAPGEPQAALTMSASNETAAYAPVAHWNAGLAAWRLGRLDEARSHFQALARSSDQSAWVNPQPPSGPIRKSSSRRGGRENYGYWLKIAAERCRRPSTACWRGI